MAKPPSNAMEIYTVGKRWMWKFQHVTGQREINELHLPAGQPVKLLIGSEDVIHSVYFPAFRVKMDAVPGRTTTMWFTPTKPGRYHLFCTEYCGMQPLGDDRLGHRDGARRLPDLAVGRPREREHGRGRPAALHEPGLRRPAIARTTAGRGPSLRGVFGSTVQPPGRRHGHGRRELPPRVDREPPGEARRGLPAAHADLPGARDARSS